MKTVLSLALALAVHGEIRTTAQHLPGGATAILVQASGASPVQVVAIRYRLAGQEGEFHQYFDELTDGVAPKAEFTVDLPYTLPRNGKGRTPPLADGIVHAAIFSDGSTEGEPELIRRLVLRRANLLQAVEMSLALIGDAGRHNTSRARMIADFQRMADSVHRWYLPEEQQAGFRVYQSIGGKLTNMVEGPVGAAFPPNEFVEQEMAALNRQRTRLLASQPSLADPAQNGR